MIFQEEPGRRRVALHFSRQAAVLSVTPLSRCPTPCVFVRYRFHLRNGCRYDLRPSAYALTA